MPKPSLPTGARLARTPAETPAVQPDSVAPHLPDLWVGSELFDGAAPWLADVERFFLAFDEAPLRCSRRQCREAFSCLSDAPAGTLHKRCRGRPGPHVRGWVAGLWIANIHRILCEVEEEGDGEAPRDA